jgi:hypothetical protein
MDDLTDINIELDKQFEDTVDNYDREPKIDERREMREELHP